ncbi:MFS family permease [Allocatelliglobosispora scoriae]|uniref:MFS family permease n=1 Tax=Allocatelliglobosispora scoriae TaxID=643052 RepID=A0A841BQM6_9ACTN|nr:MFS transporter [Allocatelliglobosispora scoriae]MBB5869489.1 MFS family permease [Allocatelliglobosispora scoriae]
MSVVTSPAGYRGLVRVTGPGFLGLSFLARLPAAMGPLGVITLVAVATGSFAVAGAVAAAYGIGAALGGPVVGALADRHGQRLVGAVAALIDAAALVAVVVAVRTGATPVVVGLLAAAAGFATPQVGPLVRVRWAALLGDRGEQRNLPTAFSYEGAADELSYMAGPALVGLVAVLGSPSAPLLVAAGLTVAAAVPFALHRTAPPVVRAPRAAAVAVRLPIAAVIALVVAMVAIGAVFGATQTGVTAYASSVGASGSAGLIYAVLGVGSAIAGLATAWIPARIGLLTRYVVAAIALAAGGALLVVMPGTLVGVLVAMAVIGVVSAPYLISVYGVANAITPARRAGTVMTLLASGVVAGVALGAAAAGRLADSHGYQAAFLLPLLAGAAALALALASLRPLRGALTHVPPTVATPQPEPAYR